MSTIDALVPMLSASGGELPARLTLVSAGAFEGAHVPPFPPDAPALIGTVDDVATAARIREVLSTVYPPDHRLQWKTPGGESRDVAMSELETTLPAGAALFVPPLAAGTSFEALQEVVAHLRAPYGCPWDREQTHLTLRKHLLEESYEVLAAIDSGDLGKMREELGDLTLQALMHAQIANEDAEFRMADVLKGIHDKLVRRHPHVFGDVRVGGVDDVLQNWEKLKAAERKSSGEEEKSLLDGIPAALPGLSQAQEYQDRAARVGFDWKEIDGVLDKVREEIEEVRQAEDAEALAAELGDLLFALVNLARWKKVDAESALRGTNLRFKRRLAYVESGARASGRSLPELSLEEMDALWNEAKRREG